MAKPKNANRKPNTDEQGQSFTEATREKVWNKAEIISGKDSEKFRKDTCGAEIKWSAYGDTESAKGWEIDHKKPVAKGGSDELANLQALQWQNNRHKGDNYPSWDCNITQ